MRMRSAGMPTCSARRAPRASVRITSVTTPPGSGGYVTPRGSVRGGRPPVCEQTTPAPISAATPDELGVVPGPGVVHEVHAQPARLAGHLRAPGVQAQHELGVLRACVLEKGQDPVHLLLSADVLTLLAGPHPAHVHDVGAGLDSRLERAARRLEVGMAVGGEEGVRRAVDDGHDRRGGGVERPAAQSQRRRARQVEVVRLGQVHDRHPRTPAGGPRSASRTAARLPNPPRARAGAAMISP